jgi:hypothetical protein
MAKQKWAIVPSGEGWRKELAKHKLLWLSRDLDKVHQQIEDDVYVRALNGQQMTQIARWYGVETRDFAVLYQDVWQLGNAEMKATIAQDTLEYGLTSKIPVAKIWLGKAMGGLGETRTVDVESNEDDSELQINVKVIRREASTEAE